MITADDVTCKMATQTETDPFRENEENQNRKWTRNPFTSRRYILPLVSLFVISLSALLAAILIYFLHVEQQEKRLGQLEQKIVQVQEEANLKWKTVADELGTEIRNLKENVTDIEVNRLRMLEQRITDFQEISNSKWLLLAEQIKEVLRTKQNASAEVDDWEKFPTLDVEDMHDEFLRANYTRNSVSTIRPNLFFFGCFALSMISLLLM